MIKPRYEVYVGWQVVAVMDTKVKHMVAVYELAYHPDAQGSAQQECDRLNETFGKEVQG